VDPSKTSRDSGGPEEKETDKAALLVCVWTRKFPPVSEEELVESETLEWRGLLVDFKKTTVGFLGRLLWALRDTLMGLLVVVIFKSLVTLKDPSILPFLPSAMMVSPVTEFTDTGLFVDLRMSERKLYPDRWSTSSTNRGRASVKDETWRIP
jgi:hypothetical protein